MTSMKDGALLVSAVLVSQKNVMKTLGIQLEILCSDVRRLADSLI